VNCLQQDFQLACVWYYVLTKSTTLHQSKLGEISLQKIRAIAAHRPTCQRSAIIFTVACDHESADNQQLLAKKPSKGSPPATWQGDTVKITMRTISLQARLCCRQYCRLMWCQGNLHHTLQDQSTSQLIEQHGCCAFRARCDFKSARPFRLHRNSSCIEVVIAPGLTMRAHPSKALPGTSYL